LNTPGTIDADYRGEVKVLLINHGQEPFTITRGERIAQMVIAPITQPNFQRVESRRFNSLRANRVDDQTCEYSEPTHCRYAE